MSKPKSAGRVRQSYKFISAHWSRDSVKAMCEVLDVAPSGYYEWLKSPLSNRAQEDVRLLRLIRASFTASTGIYGAPRVFLDLREAGETCSKHRVARLMRENDFRALHGCRTRRWTVGKTTVLIPNLLQRQFMVTQPSTAWVTDIKYIRTWQGWLYPAVVLDLCSRRVVGWAASRSPDAAVALAAWHRAAALRQPAPGLLHHSDRGSIYACRAYQEALAARHATPSMSRRGDCWDNAVVESVVATLKRGLVHRQTWATRSSLTRALVDYIEGWYNPERRHSPLDYVCPIAYEAQLARAA
ncbi:MAG: IS3 family transposase [Gemmatimonadetes bacterium]|nr:IS3 family transposase [Gemmatimonadota bacterium]